MLTDAHCHIELEEFDADRQAVLERAKAQGLCYIVSCGTEVRYYDKLKRLCEAFEIVYGVVGLHPHVSSQMDSNTEKAIEEAFSHRKIIGIGECGLDFFKNYAQRSAQLEAFERQALLAKRLSAPLIVHSRASAKETLDVLKEKGVSGLIHCFSYDRAYAKAFLDLGFYISLPGTVTYQKADTLRDVVKFLPLDRILTETDSPFLAPEPKRGRRNEPSFVLFTLRKVAEIKGVKEVDLAQRVMENLLALFPKLRRGQ